MRSETAGVEPCTLRRSSDDLGDHLTVDDPTVWRGEDEIDLATFELMRSGPTVPGGRSLNLLSLQTAPKGLNDTRRERMHASRSGRLRLSEHHADAVDVDGSPDHV